MPLRKPPPSPNRPSSPSSQSSSPSNTLKRHQRQQSQPQSSLSSDHESNDGRVSFFRGWPMVTKSPRTRSEALAETQSITAPMPSIHSSVVVTTPEVPSIHPFVPSKQYSAPDLDPEMVKAVASRRRSTHSTGSQVAIPPAPLPNGSALVDSLESCEPMSSVGVVTDAENYILVMRLHAFSRDNITISTKRPRTLRIVADKYDDEASGAGGQLLTPSKIQPQHADSTASPSTPCSTGHFERRISFGNDADMSLIAADYDGELLTVSVPRKQAKIMQGGTIVFQGGFGAGFDGASEIIIPTPPVSLFPSHKSLTSLRQGTHNRVRSQPEFTFPDNRDTSQKTVPIVTQVISPSSTQSYVPTRTDNFGRSRGSPTESLSSSSSTSSFTPPLSFSSSASSTDDVTQSNREDTVSEAFEHNAYKGDSRRLGETTCPSEEMASLMLSSPRLQVNGSLYGLESSEEPPHGIINQDDLPTPTQNRVRGYAGDSVSGTQKGKEREHDYFGLVLSKRGS